MMAGNRLLKGDERMGKLIPGINMEFVRSADLSFEAGVKIAAEMGYKYIEPMVHNGRELLSEAGYFHSFSMDNDALLMKEICDAHGVQCSGLSAHCPLMRPEISVNYLKRAIQFAADVGAPIVNTDEGPKPPWMSDDMAWTVMEYTLTQVLQTAERYGVYIGVEDHQIYTQHIEGLQRLASLVDSPMLTVNYDAGNSYIAGNEPIDMLNAVLDKVYHVHAKDIDMKQAEARGTVTGVPVGCACGDGLVDWTQIAKRLQTLPRDIVLSVECGTIEEAEKSLAHLTPIIDSLH